MSPHPQPPGPSRASSPGAASGARAAGTRAHRAGKAGKAAAPRVGSTRGRRANILSFTLTSLGALAGGWALIATGRALGALVLGEPLREHLVQALVAAVACGCCHALALVVSRTSASREEAHLRRLTLGHLLALGPARAADARSGATVSLLTDGAERVALYRQTFLAPTAAAVVSPLLVLAELAVAADAVTAGALAAAVVVVPVAIALLHRRLRASSSQSRHTRMRLAAEYLDAIQGLGTLTLARAAQRTGRSLRRTGEDNRRAIMGVLAGNQLVILVTDGLFSLCLITMAAGLALARLSSGAIGGPEAAAIILASYVLLEPLDHVGAFFYVGMAGLANQRALRRILARPAPVEAAGSASEDAAGATTSRATDDDAGAPGQAEGGAGGGAGTVQPIEVALEGVRAAWDDPARPVLRGVDLHVRRGERVAVVGPSGSGKSTLLALLAGNLLPSGGRMEVHGTELGAASQHQVRAASALVAQSSWLFTGTIADNLLLARPRATREQMWRALEAANLDREVRAMPRGLETGVGEAGLGLSGGQAQRLSLARAILADRPLLLLDEPTSQVDLASEAAIIEAVERLPRDRTIITVSHRPGALVRADRTLRVAGGRVEEVRP